MAVRRFPALGSSLPAIRKGGLAGRVRQGNSLLDQILWLRLDPPRHSATRPVTLTIRDRKVTLKGILADANITGHV
jgi:hypothetical protein